MIDGRLVCLLAAEMPKATSLGLRGWDWQRRWEAKGESTQISGAERQWPVLDGPARAGAKENEPVQTRLDSRARNIPSVTLLRAMSQNSNLESGFFPGRAVYYSVYAAVYITSMETAQVKKAGRLQEGCQCSETHFQLDCIRSRFFCSFEFRSLESKAWTCPDRKCTVHQPRLPLGSAPNWRAARCAQNHHSTKLSS
ncbi:hypothetical protein N658DRAFT_31127 [Parathielavia hyrcaniae]|uniref:Uncharacterized protein n=1 Tax=Parathielavia hyrcaniae TaxID=113614 RepID=A0AAN6QDI2_9PEZI|nr:hypothetical protein N658DRAFT_31127 [Parathielavia hyrcaniae]